MSITFFGILLRHHHRALLVTLLSHIIFIQKTRVPFRKGNFGARAPLPLTLTECERDRGEKARRGREKPLCSPSVRPVRPSLLSSSPLRRYLRERRLYDNIISPRQTDSARPELVTEVGHNKIAYMYVLQTQHVELKYVP